SKSICANLAEGFGKQVGSRKEFRNYVLISLGSSDEMQLWIRYRKDLTYITEDEANRLIQRYQEISKMLNNLYKYASQKVVYSKLKTTPNTTFYSTVTCNLTV